MFSSEMHPVIFCTVLIQLFILFYFIIESLRLPNKVAIKRFIYFTLFLMIYNITSGIFPDKNIPLPILLQNIISYSLGLFAGLSYVKYIYDVFDVVQYKILSLKNLTISLSISFIFLFVIPLLITKDLLFSKNLFIYVPVVISLVFLYKTSISLISIIKQKTKSERIYSHYYMRVQGALLSLTSITLLPIIVALGDFQVVECLVVNSGYFILTFILIQDLIYETRKSSEFLRKTGYSNESASDENISIINKFNALGFTHREVEIANYIIKNHTYKEIASTLYVTEGTISKHASNIYKKCSVANKHEFLLLFTQ